jgi:hypothetical protein
MQVTDNPKPPSLLPQDDAQAPGALSADTILAALYRPHRSRTQKTGLTRFRRNQVIFKGFGSGGAPRPTLPRSAWKRAV